ncbi:ABC transporter ATP-binding protein [Candidatus Woesearchaeota archaeon]|nr:ABC transporter ATP-binding protein [Candidatus Woesearchaeota archaeon]
MIELTDIKFKYENSDFKLNIGNLKINSGSSIALIGPSGCGKTTLMSLMAGILLPHSGSISINSHKINNFSDSQRRLFRIQNIGFVFQDFALIDYLSLYENILHPYRINSSLILDNDVKKRAKYLAEGLGISKRLKNYPSQTSIGEQQRCAIARALLNKPSVILADEPTGNLDPKNKEEILDILMKYTKENDAILIVVTHNHELLKYFDKVFNFEEFLQ